MKKPESILKLALETAQPLLITILRATTQFASFVTAIQSVSGDGEDVLKYMTKFTLFKQPNKGFAMALQHLIDAISSITFASLDPDLKHMLEIIILEPQTLPRNFLWQAEKDLISPLSKDPIAKDLSRCSLIHYMLVKAIATQCLINPAEFGLIDKHTDIVDHNFKAAAVAVYKIARHLMKPNQPTIVKMYNLAAN